MKTTDYKIDNKAVSYEITEDGYDIYLGGEKWISQHDNEKGQFGKPKDRSLSYEENCLAQIEEICNPPEPQEDETQQRLSALEEENINLSTTLDDILTNIIPSITENDSNK